MTRSKQGELFLLTQAQASYAVTVSMKLTRKMIRASASCDTKRVAALSSVLELLTRCEFEEAMHEADAAGFTSAALPSLIDVNRKIGRLMAELTGASQDDGSERVEIEAASVGSVRPRQMPTHKQDAQNARTMWRMHRRKANQLEAALGKIWHYLTSEAEPMHIDDIQNELTTVDRCVVDDAVDAFKREVEL